MTVRKSFSFFICIVIVSIIGVLFLSIDSSTFDALNQADSRLIFAAMVLVVCGWLLDACKFIALSRAAGERLSLKKTLSVVWINYFGCAITPMQSGGGPFQIYLLYCGGVSVGKSVAITLVRTLQVIFILALVVPFAIMAEPEFVESHVVLKWFVAYVTVFLSVASILLIISVIRPQWMKRGSSWVLLKMKKLGILKPMIILHTARLINKEIDNYCINIRLFMSTGRGWFLLSIALAVVHLLVYMSVMPCLIAAMGYHVNYTQCILAESLFIFLLYFVPTPGASGAAEGGAAAVFGLFVPWNMAGVMAVAWRLLSEYTGVALGTVIALKMLGWGGMDKVMKEESQDFENES